MKKSLITLLLAGTFLSFAGNVNSQNIKAINPKKMQETEIPQSNESYNERLNKINSIKYNDYRDMLSEVKDPIDAEIYCTEILKRSENPHADNKIDKMIYGGDDYWASFKESFFQRLGDCDDGAMAAAALLYDNGFHPYFLDLDGKDVGHLIFLYKDKEGKYGTIGIDKIDCRKPKYKKIEDLFNEINKEANDKFSSYRVLDAKDIFPDAIDKEGNYKIN